jgi:hypothetical protein
MAKHGCLAHSSSENDLLVVGSLCAMTSVLISVAPDAAALQPLHSITQSPYRVFGEDGWAGALYSDSCE